MSDRPLEAALRTARAEQSAEMSAEVQSLDEALCDEFRRALESADTLQVGDLFPEFELPDQVGAPVRGSDLLKLGPIVVSLYRGLWCPYCQLELRHLAMHRPEFHAEGAQIVAISPQTPDRTLTMAQKLLLDFRVLSDTDGELARRLGVLVKIPEHLRKGFDEHYAPFADRYRADAYCLPIPGSYVVDTSGRVVYAQVNPDPSVRAEPADILQVLRIHRST